MQWSPNVELVRRIDNTVEGERLGTSIAGLPDLNGDRIGEIVAGAPGADSDESECPDSLPGRGLVRLLSGADGSVIRTRCGTAQGESFGQLVRSLGDVNGDGAGDYGVTAPTASSDDACPDAVAGRGVVRIYSGRTGNLLQTHCGYSAYENIGSLISEAGDLDGDGLGDIVFGSPRASTHPVACPERPTHSTLCPLPPAGQPDRPCARGYVEGRSGKDGSLLFATCGRRPSSLFGFWIAPADSPLGFGVKDIEGDSLPDLLAGAPLDTCTSGEDVQSAEGVVYVLRSSEVWNLNTGSEGRVCGATPGGGAGGLPPGPIRGDLNGDGIDDLVLGSALATDSEEACPERALFGGVVQGLFMPDIGQLETESDPRIETFSVCGGEGDGLGSGTDFLPIGDLDQDGQDDVDWFLAGAPGADPEGRVNAGSIFIFRTID